MNKSDLLSSIRNDTATFIKEEHDSEDVWLLFFEFEGIEFTVEAHGRERWIMDDVLPIEDVVHIVG